MQSLPALGLFGHGKGRHFQYLSLLPSHTQSQKKAELGKKQQKTNEQNSELYTARQSSGPPDMLNFLPSLSSLKLLLQATHLGK